MDNFYLLKIGLNCLWLGNRYFIVANLLFGQNSKLALKNIATTLVNLLCSDYISQVFKYSIIDN